MIFGAHRRPAGRQSLGKLTESVRRGPLCRTPGRYPRNGVRRAEYGCGEEAGVPRVPSAWETWAGNVRPAAALGSDWAARPPHRPPSPAAGSAPGNSPGNAAPAQRGPTLASLTLQRRCPTLPRRAAHFVFCPLFGRPVQALRVHRRGSRSRASIMTPSKKSALLLIFTINFLITFHSFCSPVVNCVKFFRG